MCRGAAVSAPALRALCRNWSRERKRGRGGGPGGPGGPRDGDDSDGSSSGSERSAGGGGKGGTGNGNGSHTRIAGGAPGSTGSSLAAVGKSPGGADGCGGGAGAGTRVVRHGHTWLGCTWRGSCSHGHTGPSWESKSCSDVATQSRVWKQAIAIAWPVAVRSRPSGGATVIVRGHVPVLCILNHVRDLMSRFRRAVPAPNCFVRSTRAPPPPRAWAHLLLAAAAFFHCMRAPPLASVPADRGASGAVQALAGGACGAGASGVCGGCRPAAMTGNAAVPGAGAVDASGRGLRPLAAPLQRGLRVVGGRCGTPRRWSPAVNSLKLCPSVKARPSPSRMGPALMML